MGIKKDFLNLKSFMTQNTLFSGLAIHSRRMNKTEQQKYTNKPSIFKQGPSKRALHSAPFELLFTLLGSIL